MSPIISGQGGGGGGPTKLFATALGADAANIDWTSIAGSFSLLLIVGKLRVGTAATEDNVRLRFNGDTGNNYAWQYASGSGATASANAAGAGAFAYFPITAAGTTADASTFHHFRLEIFSYAGAAHKQITCQTSRFPTYATTTSYTAAELAGFWNNTAAITRITFDNVSGNNILAGSAATCYAFT